MTTATATATAGTPGRKVTIVSDDGLLWSGVRKHAHWVVTMTCERDAWLPARHREYVFSNTERDASKMAARFTALGWDTEMVKIRSA